MSRSAVRPGEKPALKRLVSSTPEAKMVWPNGKCWRIREISFRGFSLHFSSVMLWLDLHTIMQHAKLPVYHKAIA